VWDIKRQRQRCQNCRKNWPKAEAEAEREEARMGRAAAEAGIKGLREALAEASRAQADGNPHCAMP
jgi:hypothetical protein